MAFFGTVTKTMLTAMMKRSESNSDSGDSATLSSSHHKSKRNISKSYEYKPNTKSKLLNPKNKTIGQRSPIKKP